MIILQEKTKIRSGYRMPLDFNFIENLIGLQDINVTFVNVNNGVVEIYAESNLLTQGYYNYFIWK
jgi:hypothetical protein